MEKLMGFWCLIFVGILFSKRDAESFELDEFFSGNETNVSFLESLSYLESVYGIADATPPANALMVGLTLINGAAAKGAVCLDGSLPGYHLHRGFGSGANSWLIQLESVSSVPEEKSILSMIVLDAAFRELSQGESPRYLLCAEAPSFSSQGGGWCNNVRTCVYRKKTHRGSSTYFERQIGFTGILSNKAWENPDFFNWNRVKIRYCDGASFSGDGENKAAGLQFRGQRIWRAAMEELMSKGMRNAKQALLSGCSAGGLASILHCDEFRDLFPSNTKVKCLSDAGLFMDVVDVSGGRTIRDFFGGVVRLQGVQKNLPSSCTKHYDPTSCFFPENLIANIRTPLFLLNAAYDAWQVQESLAPPKADPHGSWHVCRMNIDRCSASQIQFLQGFRIHMLNKIKGFAASRQSGLFLNSCFAHCQSERQDTWFGGNSPKIGNKAIATSVGDWYFDRANVKSIDCVYPCDRTCHNLAFR